MMGRLHLTAAEVVAVVLDDGIEEVSVHFQQTLIGMVLSPSTLHISIIARGHLLNLAGANLFVAEFMAKADMDRVLDGPPWVVGKHAVLLQGFNAGLKPQNMVFNKLNLWVRIINLPFGYMQKMCGTTIARPLCVNGGFPKVDCDASGRCWGSYMCVRVEVDVDKWLWRGITVFSQRRNATDWFDIQYENLPHYYHSCGVIGHSSIECKNPGDRDEEGKLPYFADRLCAYDDRKKKYQGARSSSGSISTGEGRSCTPVKERPSQSGNLGDETEKQTQTGEYGERLSQRISVPVLSKTRQARLKRKKRRLPKMARC
jgi:hypothetical protein